MRTLISESEYFVYICHVHFVFIDKWRSIDIFIKDHFILFKYVDEGKADISILLVIYLFISFSVY